MAGGHLQTKRGYLQAAQETKGSWVGWCPTRKFISGYMSIPGAIPQDPTWGDTYAEVVFPSCSNDDDDDSIEAFLTSIRDSRLCSDTMLLHVMMNTPATTSLDPTDESIQSEPSSTKATEDTTRQSPSFSWHEPGLFIEFAKGGDPFYETDADYKEHGTIEKDDFPSAESRGRLAAYAREVFYHQHCTHVFQLLVFGNEARFIRRNRLRAVISQKFNYVDEPEPLKLFFYVYSRMSRTDRGWDPTVVPATPQEEQLYRTACATRFASLPEIDAVRAVWEAMPAMDLSSTWDESWPTYSVTLDLVGGFGEKDTLIIKRPFYAIRARIVGRTARAYLAYSTRFDRLVFFKDGWRSTSGVHVPEALAYKRLRQFQVAYTPKTLAGGDVRRQGTGTNDLLRSLVAKKEGKEPHPRAARASSLRQHRIVQELVCPLQYLPSTKDVVGVIRDCYVAILQACKAGVLHRDLSVANIMATYNTQTGRWEGVLNDWDVCGPDKTLFDRKPTRVGTWSYLSIEHLQDPSKQHDIMDDSQSLFWVLLYTVAVYFNPSAKLDFAMFSEKHTAKIDGREQQVAGRLKMDFFKDDVIRPFLLDVKSKSLEWLLLKMTSHWKEYYLLKVELARENIKGVHNALCIAKYVTGVSQLTSTKQLAAAKAFARKHVLVRHPQFWIDMCNKAIEMDEWVPDAAPGKYEVASRSKQEGEVAAAMAKGMCVSRVGRSATPIVQVLATEHVAPSLSAEATGQESAGITFTDGQRSLPNKRSRETADADPKSKTSSLSTKRPRPISRSAGAVSHDESSEVCYIETRAIGENDGEQ